MRSPRAHVGTPLLRRSGMEWAEPIRVTRKPLMPLTLRSELAILLPDQEWEVEKERLKVKATQYVRLLLAPGPPGESRIQLSLMPIPGIDLSN